MGSCSYLTEYLKPSFVIPCFKDRTGKRSWSVQNASSKKMPNALVWNFLGVGGVGWGGVVGGGGMGVGGWGVGWGGVVGWVVWWWWWGGGGGGGGGAKAAHIRSKNWDSQPLYS